MTDKLFTKRLRDLTDDAIRESLAEISVEFEKRFGPAALTASPPVVEREAIARIIDPNADPEDGTNVSYLLWIEALAKADDILALTSVEGDSSK